MIKLLIGGSPCTFWSIAQKNGRETEASGMGWELFKNFLIAKDKFKPDFFLYENNKSAAQPIKDQIATELGVDLMYINSALVSAQNRQRFYAFNWEVDQPEDRGIVLRDILETGLGEKSYLFRIPEYGFEDKSRPVTACYAYKGSGEGSLVSEAFPDNPNKQVRDYVAEPVRIGDIGSTAQAHRVYSCDGKSVTLSANGGGQGGKTGLYATPIDTFEHCAVFNNPHGWNEGFMSYEKFPTLTTGSCSRQWNTIIEPAEFGREVIKNEKPLRFLNKVYEVKDGLITIKDKQYPIKLADGNYIIRKLTPVECERLQTLPDGYTRAVSNTQRYRGLGNGWTAEIIIHILNGALKDVPRDEEIVVLSMYDGIGTGRYCLDKMGFTNVKYFAYEIDKYAKEVSMSNYPDIIQLGDAFDLRHPDWTIGY